MPHIHSLWKHTKILTKGEGSKAKEIEHIFWNLHLYGGGEGAMDYTYIYIYIHNLSR